MPQTRRRGPPVGADGRALLNVSAATDPPAAIRRLTAVGEPFAAGHELVSPERFAAVSPDGSDVDAWIVRPAGSEPGRRYPMLLSIHGGPLRARRRQPRLAVGLRRLRLGFHGPHMDAFLFADEETCRTVSPATCAADIYTPPLILHSENDLRCPVEQAENLFATLRLPGRPV